MSEKFYKYFFFFFFSIITLLILLVTFNSDLRRKSLTYIVNGYKVYMIVSLQDELKKNIPDYYKLNKKLNNYISISNKIAYGKSKILIGIYDAANLVQSRIVNFEDHGYLEEFNKNLIKADPLLYSAKIWYAKSLLAKNHVEKAIEQIDEAIKISPVEDEPYRLGTLIALKSNNKDLFKKYCKNYKTSKFGGQQKRYKNLLFTGLNLNKFGIKFFNKESEPLNNEIYTHNGINLGKFDEYEIVPIEPLDLKNLNLYFSFNAGTSLEIKKITFLHQNGKEEISSNDLIIESNNSFFSPENNNKLIFTLDDDEVVRIYLSEKIENVQKVLINMKVDKMNIVNNCNI